MTSRQALGELLEFGVDLAGVRDTLYLSLCLYICMSTYVIGRKDIILEDARGSWYREISGK